MKPPLPPSQYGNSDDSGYRDPEAFLRSLDEPIVTPAMESQPDLPPALKVRALQAGAHARGLKIAPRRDPKAAAVFFAANPLWTPAHLLALLEKCRGLGQPHHGDDHLRWHAKQGHEFRFLLRNLATILKELDLTGKFPELRIVLREELYKPCRPRANKRNKSVRQPK
jgi:hypothetical protein